jgi:Rrf2 family protein
MLSLTRKTEYGLIAVCHLARAGDLIVSARDIAAKYTIPLPLLMNVLKTLNRRGLVESVRGAHGGYTLASPAERITLEALIEAIEERPVRLVRCAPVGEHGVGESARTGRCEDADGGEADCELLCTCPVRHPLHRLQERLRSFLAEVTVADVAFDAAFAGGDGPYRLTRSS